jgi:metal-responsive CopG/Arc/MetJ family transcriptional regulator
MIRTQVYLTTEQVTALRSIAQRSGRKQSELIRDALDAFIEGGRDENADAVLSRVAGMWKDRSDLPDFSALRTEWDRDSRQ